ncbi:hypothetical protein CI102_13207 [Trichoderma harzianum]|uniref:Uncharacterized protein n=1 Tax=Trichoderma harzianum CBS 226.95 TaxID=983964 RepID=A0A2T4ALX7_TRIHA|nr:hypothetical protein M431DRAFT_505646 [Trichoderma harzianum CBS 226.95]PKK42193.1 hypothetical protein CI102_13207 [Trichoderma harzianum]PTB58083.1 hypothetical protein M431DRAFT_505646 [Trichoderma harzianum CBS 226.95]
MDSTDEYMQSSAPRAADIGDSPLLPQPSRGSRRQGQRMLATVYDAVAGRVTYDGVLRDEGQDQRKFQPGIVDQRSARDGFKLAPDDVLFRRKDAPERYAEHDIYRAHDWELPNGGQGVLPQSDLLKAIHEYSSEFYGALNRNQRVLESGRNLDERSMDETALLALGILLEEAGREVLGQRGHLVFTKGSTQDNYDDGSGEQEWQGGNAAQDSGGDSVVGHEDSRSRQPGRKRRKLAKADDD